MIHAALCHLIYMFKIKPTTTIIGTLDSTFGNFTQDFYILSYLCYFSLKQNQNLLNLLHRHNLHNLTDVLLNFV